MPYLKFLLPGVILCFFQANSCRSSPYLEKSVELSLISAVKTGSPIEVQGCLDTKADVGATDEDGNTALHWACYLAGEKSIDIIDRLLKAGADIHAKGLHGGTPLHLAYASEGNSIRIIERLLKAGADVHAKDIDGYRPVDWIEKYPNSFIKKLFENLKISSHYAEVGHSLKSAQAVN